jgi:4-hydroxy-tetrahydrodipicolinate synthase
VDLKAFQAQLAGVAAVTVTPFTPTLEVDEGGLRAVVRHLDDEGGADTIVACGGTAEYYALTPDERCQVALTVLDEARRAPVVISVGLDAADAGRAAAEAEKHGAAGIMIHQPIHPYVHPDGLLDYYRQICAAVSIGVVAYVRDPAISTDLLARIVAIDNVVGVKYAVNDVRRFGTIVDRLSGESDVEWLCGTAEAWAPFFWLAGATGFTSGLANFAVREAVGMRDALRSGDADEIRRVWKRLRPIEDLRSRYADANNIACLKAGIALCGLAGDAIRPPLRPLPPSEVSELAEILRGWGVLPGATGTGT